MADIIVTAKGLADARKIKNVVVASDAGGSARAVLEVFGEGYNVVAVGIPPEVDRMEEVYRTIQELSAKGVKYILSYPLLGHPISDLDRKFHSPDSDPLRIIQQTLRLFGEGAKVCIEVAMIAADQDLLPLDEDCVAVCRPPDESNCPHTAIVLRPAKSADIFNHELRVKEIALVPGPRDHWFTNGPLWQG